MNSMKHIVVLVCILGLFPWTSQAREGEASRSAPRRAEPVTQVSKHQNRERLQQQERERLQQQERERLQQQERERSQH